jgi:hypothetical protein
MRAGRMQGIYFGMRLTESLVPAFAHDAVLANHDSAHERIGFNEPAASVGKLQGTAHPLPFGMVHPVRIDEEDIKNYSDMGVY